MRVPITAVTICVSYDDILALTLPYNRQHFAQHWIITSSADTRTQEVAKRHGAEVYVTDEFYAYGAEFAKWRAMEIALDAIGRRGWMLLLDADVCWPKNASDRIAGWDAHPEIGYIYCPLRRMLENPQDLLALKEKGVPPEDYWRKLPIHRNVNEWAGYSLLVNAADSTLPQGHWHDISWRHCGGADSEFQARWPAQRKVRIPFECLHIGGAGQNWFGRSTAYVDGRPAPKEAADRARKNLEIWSERRRSGFAKEKTLPKSGQGEE